MHHRVDLREFGAGQTPIAPALGRSRSIHKGRERRGPQFGEFHRVGVGVERTRSAYAAMPIAGQHRIDGAAAQVRRNGKCGGSGVALVGVPHIDAIFSDSKSRLSRRSTRQNYRAGCITVFLRSNVRNLSDAPRRVSPRSPLRTRSYTAGR